jgi:hypothetical protein
MAGSNITRLPKETLLKMIENAIGVRVFNSLFVRYKDSGEIKDICNDCEYSCAFFVSGLLTLTSYLPRPHATAAGLRKKLQELSYTIVLSREDIQPGDIIFWEKTFNSDSEHEHVGFALSKKRAVSTSSKEHTVIEHDLTMPRGPSQEPVRIILILRVPEEENL